MLLTAEFVRQGSFPHDCSVADFCSRLTTCINKVYADRSLLPLMEQHPEDRLTASAVVYSRMRHEIWMIGDCQAMVNGQLYSNDKPYEKQIANERARLIHDGLSPQEARRAIEPMLIEAMLQGQNSEYAVIDGFPIHMPGVRVINAGTPDAEIVLASDGYPFLCPTLQESEEALARQLATDPQNVLTFIATKGITEGNASFDDRAYVRVKSEE